MKVLYGEGMLVYNVHGLIHLAGDVRRFGTLDKFSAFPFENALKRIKKLVRKPSLPLQQLTDRLFEKQQFGKTETLACSRRNNRNYALETTIQSAD